MPLADFVAFPLQVVLLPARLVALVLRGVAFGPRRLELAGQHVAVAGALAQIVEFRTDRLEPCTRLVELASDVVAFLLQGLVPLAGVVAFALQGFLLPVYLVAFVLQRLVLLTHIVVCALQGLALPLRLAVVVTQAFELLPRLVALVLRGIAFASRGVELGDHGVVAARQASDVLEFHRDGVDPAASLVECLARIVAIVSGGFDLGGQRVALGIPFGARVGQRACVFGRPRLAFRLPSLLDELRLVAGVEQGLIEASAGVGPGLQGGGMRLAGVVAFAFEPHARRIVLVGNRAGGFLGALDLFPRAAFDGVGRVALERQFLPELLELGLEARANRREFALRTLRVLRAPQVALEGGPALLPLGALGLEPGLQLLQSLLDLPVAFLALAVASEVDRFPGGPGVGQGVFERRLRVEPGGAVGLQLFAQSSQAGFGLGLRRIALVVLGPERLAGVAELGLELVACRGPPFALGGQGLLQLQHFGLQGRQGRGVFGLVRRAEVAYSRFELAADVLPARTLERVSGNRLLLFLAHRVQRAFELRACRTERRRIARGGLELGHPAFQGLALGGERLIGAVEFGRHLVEPRAQARPLGGQPFGLLQPCLEAQSLGLPGGLLAVPGVFELGVVALHGLQRGLQGTELSAARVRLGVFGARHAGNHAAAAAGVALEHHRIQPRANGAAADGQRIEGDRRGFAVRHPSDQIGDRVLVGRCDELAEVAADDVARPARAEQLEGRGVHGQHVAAGRDDDDSGGDVLDNLSEPLFARPRFGLLRGQFEPLVDAAQRGNQPTPEDPRLEDRVVGAQFQRGGGDVGRPGRGQDDDGQIRGLRLDRLEHLQRMRIAGLLVDDDGIGPHAVVARPGTPDRTRAVDAADDPFGLDERHLIEQVPDERIAARVEDRNPPALFGGEQVWTLPDARQRFRHVHERLAAPDQHVVGAGGHGRGEQILVRVLDDRHDGDGNAIAAQARDECEDLVLRQRRGGQQSLPARSAAQFSQRGRRSGNRRDVQFGCDRAQLVGRRRVHRGNRSLNVKGLDGHV